MVVKEYAAVSSVHFARSDPYDYAVTSGSRVSPPQSSTQLSQVAPLLHPLQVQVYSGTTNQVTKTISRFREAAYSGCFRDDGKLLAAGTEDGVVKVFDVSSRAILRQCRGHRK